MTGNLKDLKQGCLGWIVIILLTVLLALCQAKCSEKDKEDKKADKKEQVVEQPTAIYICNSPTAETYHNNPECRGLSRCRYEVVEVTQEEAEELGRRPCKICY